MKKNRFLWIDDEIDLLKPYILFLEEKGYSVTAANNGRDALDVFRAQAFDMVFLDEHMPGLSGLETLAMLNALNPSVPVVMITKSEDEGIMNKAIGKKIADYLIKPVNPNQILLAIKKILDKNEIIAQTATVDYRDEFNTLSTEISQCTTYADWAAVYKKLVYWELQLAQTQHPMLDVLQTQKADAQSGFVKFVKSSYRDWMQNGGIHAPTMSPQLLRERVFPHLENGEKLFFLLIDNFRFDQWESIKDIVGESFNCMSDLYFSILPTATQYARNSIFSGLMPVQIAENFPDLWLDETADESKNQAEERLLQLQMERLRLNYSVSYRKINSNADAEKLLHFFPDFERFDLNVLIVNFIDMLSHARTESKMIQELAPDESAYRALTRLWFQHSPLSALLKKIAEKGYKAVLTTDHGTIRVKKPQQILGEKSTNTNLRYKLGRNLDYDARKLFEITEPRNVGLPAPNISTRYVFALGNDFFAYPNNFRHYSAHYENTFQHGGISMEEMMVPLVTLFPR